MLSKAFKYCSLLFASCLLFIPHTMAFTGGGIPVECAGCVDATDKAAVTTAASVGEYIEAQTKALEMILEYVMNTQEYNAGVRERLVAETEDFKRSERALGMGARPFGACGEYEATAMAIQRDVAQRVVSENFSRLSKNRTRQSRQLPPGEPRMQKNVDDLIDVMEDPEAEDLVAPDVVFVEEPIPESDLEKFLRHLMLILNPFPVVTPSEEEIAEIIAHGTTGEREALAQALALQQRQEVAMKAVTMNVERNVQTLDPAAMKGLIELAKPYLANEPQWTGKLSPNQVDELLHTYRSTSPDWYTEVMSTESEFTLLREQTVMQATLLASMWELRKLIQQQLALSGFSETRSVSQAGLMSR